MIDLSKHENWCLSGGAVGADLEWGMAAAFRKQHGVIHFSFRGHRNDAPPDTLHILTDAQITEADEYCRRANKTLKRRFPAKTKHVTNLLRRDWWQVAEAGSCYAASTLKLGHFERLPVGAIVQGQVDGGTAWAVQMFIDKHDGKACDCYVFDQNAGYWFKWEGSGWLRIYEPPPPTGIWAGIGKRDLLPLGRLAIRVLMNYRMDFHSGEYPPYK